MKKTEKEPPIDPYEAASHAAAGWVARINDSRSGAEGRDDLEQWLQQDPKHREAFDRISAIWERCGELKTHPLVVAAQAKPTKRRLFRPLREWFAKTLSTRPATAALGSAAMVALVLSVVWVLRGDFSSRSMQIAEHRTRTGEQRSVTLADGSTALLDTTTAISASLSSDARRVELLHGRALFSVVHDPGRPFVVTARNAQILVLGTEFNVDMQNGKITVAVLEGRVQVLPVRGASSGDRSVASSGPDGVSRSPGGSVYSQGDPVLDGGESAGQILIPGQEAVLDEEQHLLEVHPANIERISAWRSGKLDFDRVSLEDAVAEVNRYLDQKIRIADEDLRRTRISMVFEISDCDHFLTALGKTMPVVSELAPDGGINLTRRGY